MTTERADWMISRLAFRAAMKKAFKWQFPLPDNALKALLTSPEFDEIFQENQPAPPALFVPADASLTSPVSPQHHEAEQYEALANDARVQLFVNEYLAKEKERDYLRSLVVFVWTEVQLGFRNWIRRLLNPPQGQESERDQPEKPSRPARRMRNPVLKTTAVAAVGVVVYLLYYHPPKIEITMIAPREFPKLQIDSTPVKFDTAKLHFSDIKFQESPQLNIGKLQFGTPPQLQIAKLQFDTPPTLKVDPLPELKLVKNSSITLEPDKNATMKFEPLQFKDSSIPLKFDPSVFADPSKCQVTVTHRFDGLLNSNPGFRFSDKRQGLFWPSHTYTWELISKKSPSPPADKGQPKTASRQSSDNNRTVDQAPPLD